MRGSYEVSVHNYSRKMCIIVHQIYFISSVSEYFWCKLFFKHIFISLCLWKCDRNKVGHFKNWGGRLTSILNGPKQFESPVDSHYLHFFHLQKTPHRNTKPGLGVLSCPAGRTGEKNFNLLLKLLCSHVSQKVLFSRLSYVLLIHLSFLVKSLFSFPLPTGVSSSVPELYSIQDESPAEGDKRLSSDFVLIRMTFRLTLNKKREMLDRTWYKMMYRNDMNPAWKMMALLKLKVEKQQSVFDASLIVIITIKFGLFNRISHCCTIIFDFTVYSVVFRYLVLSYFDSLFNFTHDSYIYFLNGTNVTEACQVVLLVGEMFLVVFQPDTQTHSVLQVVETSVMNYWTI